MNLSPHHARFVEYWESRRQGRNMPARRDVDPLLDLPELAAWLLIVQNHDGRIFYRVLGSSMEESNGPRTGTYLDEVRAPPFRDYLQAIYALCTAKRACVFSRNNFHHDGDKRALTSRIVTPLSSDGETVDMFLGLQISHDLAGAPLPPAWDRVTKFREDLPNDLAWRDPATGEWHNVDWRDWA
ncbi:MAG: PAS domain-containing protein [Alphaproteobacteria bacterium]|nr:PAS domain-containing protein [Alphaproteobacteria bacterium]MCA0451567.1 PAS domain-containing protein [Pseudomonadota bacterium]